MCSSEKGRSAAALYVQREQAQVTCRWLLRLLAYLGADCCRTSANRRLKPLG